MDFDHIWVNKQRPFNISLDQESSLVLVTNRIWHIELLDCKLLIVFVFAEVDCAEIALADGLEDFVGLVEFD